jgi:hypothetical protein
MAQDAIVARGSGAGGAGGSPRSAKRGGGGGGLVGALAAGLEARAAALAAGIAQLADRSDPRSRALQDAAFHASLFAAAVYAMHRWGRLLSV